MFNFGKTIHKKYIIMLNSLQEKTLLPDSEHTAYTTDAAVYNTYI